MCHPSLPFPSWPTSLWCFPYCLQTDIWAMEQQTSFHCHTCGIDRFPLHRKSSRCFRNSKHALTSIFHSFTFLSSLRVPMSHSLAWWLRSRTGEWANPSFFERIKWYTSTRSMWENNTGVKKGTVLHCKKYFDIENRLRVPRQYFATHLGFFAINTFNVYAKNTMEGELHHGHWHAKTWLQSTAIPIPAI